MDRMMIILERVANLLRRIDMKIRRDAIEFLGLRSKQNFFLDSPIAAPRDDVNRLGIYAEAETFSVPHLTHKGDTVTYSFTRRYIYEIPNAIVDPVTGMVYDQYGKYIAESMAWEPTRLLSEIPRPTIKAPSRVLKGRHVFLPSTPTYFHWLMQDLPPFLAAHGHIADAEVFTGPHDFKPLQSFTERYFTKGVRRYLSPVRVEKLIMTAKDGGLGIPFPPHGSVNPQDVRVLREWFKGYISPGNDEKKEKTMLYLSRSKWNRALEGEKELEQSLEKIGFTIFHGDIDLFEQIRLFSKANVIVGASGAAMSNMIWASANTKVVQLHLPKVYWNFYYNLGKLCNHDYHFLEVPNKSWDSSEIKNITEKIQKIINA